MRSFSMVQAAKSALASVAVVLAAVGSPTKSTAQPLPTPICAWPFEWTAFGLGNWLFPDTGNRWWYMPIDAQWRSVTISGAFPEARFFSFAVYDDAPVASALADHLFDAQIVPDPGSVNPFGPAVSSAARSKTYAITVTREDRAGSNVLRLHAETGWLLYRLYLPNAGTGSMGGAPLPAVSVTDSHGRVTPLPTCPTVNRQSELAGLQPQFVPALLENPPPTPAVPDHISFAPLPSPPVRLLPNPDNKYMVSYFMTEYKPGRVIVIRGKMPAFPDTYRGSPVSQPAREFETIELRYWSMCLGALVSPLPITGCAVDANTPLDKSGFYTVVVTNDLLRPDWVPSESVWIPWGDEQMFPKTLFLRNTLPSAQFGQSVQQAIATGCGVDFNFPTPPAHEGIMESGRCARQVMRDYYPLAVWCKRETFIQSGWKGCFSEASIE